MADDKNERKINRSHCTSKVRVDYAHVGLYDVTAAQCWIAKRKWGVTPIRVSHAKLLLGGTQDTSTADKDRFVCYWYHTPDTGEGYVHGYPIDWAEGHMLIRLDPNWNYIARNFTPNTDTAKVEHNIEQQFKWGEKIFRSYVEKHPKFPLSYHMIGPRPVDSMFYVERYEPE